MTLPSTMQELDPVVSRKVLLHEEGSISLFLSPGSRPPSFRVSAADSPLSHRDRLLTLEKLTGMNKEFMVMTVAFQGLLNM